MCLAGGAVLLLAGTRYASGAIAQDRARQEWNDIAARAAVDETRAALGSLSWQNATREGAVVGRLVVPRIGLDEIVVQGVSERALNIGPGHLPGSARPGEAGNSVISAHRDRHFRSLGRIAVGDTVYTETGVGRRGWRVTSREVIHRDAPALFHSATPILTLTTCWPIRYFGSAPDRLIVTAVPLGANSGD
jgi:LPXTG-site transpeptidase (sortase) family protein